MCHIKARHLKRHPLTEVSLVAKSWPSQGWEIGFLPVRTCMGAHGHVSQTTRPGMVLFPRVTTDDQVLPVSVYSLYLCVCLCLSLCPHTQPPGLIVSQSDIKFALNLRMSLNFWFSYLYILSTGIKGILHHAWFIFCWKSNLRPHMC